MIFNKGITEILSTENNDFYVKIQSRKNEKIQEKIN